jgi:uncharacterized protein (TIGR02569 family)
VTPPPAAVLAAFGVAGQRPEALTGGQGTAWRVGEVVLKPLDLSLAELRWQEELLSSLVPDGFRVAVPLRSAAGDLVVDGWSAWPALAGHHAARWGEIVAVGERLHRALAGTQRPAALLDARTDPWARADRVAWGEAPAGPLADAPGLGRLFAARRPVRGPDQLIHADLSGNVLFADGLPPAVIDLSPAWRPAAYASAIVRVDAVLWHDAGPGLLATLAGTADGAQHLVRALLFRLLAESDPAAAARAHWVTIERVCRLARG